MLVEGITIEDKDRQGGFRLIRVNPSTEKLLSDLGIVKKEQPVKRKRGRPRKSSI